MYTRTEGFGVSPLLSGNFATQEGKDNFREEAQEQPYEMVKPSLTNPMRRLLDLDLRMLNLSEEMMQYNIDRISAYREDLEICQQQRIEKLQETLSNQERSGFWGLLTKIGSFVLSAISLVFGIFLISTGAGTIVGGAMIAAGLLSLANLALEETGGWDYIASKIAQEDEELRTKLRLFLPIAVAIVSGIASVGGAGFAWSSIQTGGKLMAILHLATNLTVAVTTGAKGVHLAEMAWTEAEHVALKKDVFSKQEIIEELLRQTAGIERQVSRTLNTTLRLINTQS